MMQKCIKIFFWPFCQKIIIIIFLFSNLMQSNIFNKKYIIENFIDQTLSIRQQFKIDQQQVYCLKYNHSGQYLAIGTNRGNKYVYNTLLKKIVLTIQCENLYPTTGLKWKTQTSTQKNSILITTNSQGIINHFEIPSGYKISTIKQQGNSILCLDCNPNGRSFATAGKDAKIRIYDQDTKTRSTICQSSHWSTKGHNNRIFSVKYVDQNTIATGGWDSIVYIWDLRTAKVIRSIYGPHLVGDTLDSNGSELLTGSQSSKDQLQVWDIGSGQLIQSLQWISKKDTPIIYTSKFGKQDKDLILAGSSGANEIKLFKHNGQEYGSLNKICELDGGCYAVDFHPSKKQFMFTDYRGKICGSGYGRKIK